MGPLEAGVGSWGLGRGGGLSIEGLFFEESNHVKLKIYLTQGRARGIQDKI